VNVCEQLKTAKADFVALARNEKKALSLQKKGIKTVIGDFADKQSLEKAFDGIDKLFLLSVTSPDSPKLQGNAVKVAKEKGVRYIVKVSARGSAPDAPFNIGRWHGQTEEEIRDSGIDYTFLHPHSFMQNLFFDAESIKNDNAIYASMGDGRIGMVDARDIAAVAAKVLTQTGHEGKTYLLTGPEAISYYNISDVFSEKLGRKISYIAVSAEDSHKSMIASGMPGWLADDLTAINIAYSQGNGSEISPDVEKVTGQKPLSLHRFIGDNLDVFIS